MIKCTRNGGRTRTDIAAHGILSPACLPIPPSEQRLGVKRRKNSDFFRKTGSAW